MVSSNLSRFLLLFCSFKVNQPKAKAPKKPKEKEREEETEGPIHLDTYDSINSNTTTLYHHIREVHTAYDGGVSGVCYRGWWLLYDVGVGVSSALLFDSIRFGVGIFFSFARPNFDQSIHPTHSLYFGDTVGTIRIIDRQQQHSHIQSS